MSIPAYVVMIDLEGRRHLVAPWAVDNYEAEGWWIEEVIELKEESDDGDT